MAEESAVKVCVRVRPLIKREDKASGSTQLYWRADQHSVHQTEDGPSTKSFGFDRVFSAEESTSQLYQAIAKPLVESTVSGYNGTIFAYGQTSSGKTFTMMGSERTPGVIPLAVEDVFQTIQKFPNKEFLLRVSYMEIYNETVTDLLVDSWKRKPLEVRESINKNIYVADLTEELVTSPQQALAWIRKGEQNRHYGKTKMNERSSRSHTIFRMILESRVRSDPALGENADGAIIVSHLNLVDLAGSERASQTGAEGTRFKEGCNINRSLFTLSQVIKKLTDESQKGFINYRDSKLTRILQNSLGGNAKTLIICTITPVALDETLSTLQFASTARKMKNDPHVTEVSDDGALLKRYRNEIADLKRRLHEVSSVTHTTETEKEVLSQLLQEKDQLQREQEDRIKNLTRLLVTGSTLVPTSRVPKRRVTWGGKMLQLATSSDSSEFQSDFGFSRRRKADRSCLTILGEDDQDFEARWEIPEEPSDEMEVSQSSMIARSFGDSPKIFLSPEQLDELSGKVSNLEMQLELEIQQKEMSVSMVQVLEGRVAELELQLEAEATKNKETMEHRMAELHKQVQTDAQQRLQAEEKAEMLMIKVADMEEQLAGRSQAATDADEQMKKDFEESLQLCMNVASERDEAVVERNHLRQELDLFIEQMERLEKEKAALSKELEEKKQLEEFVTLEQMFSKEQRAEMQEEISSWRRTADASQLQSLELQSNLEALTEELKMKNNLLEELQRMNGKDLVQEVAALRRSLGDAEIISRDARKESALLRSRNMSLEETHESLITNHSRMESEVSGLRQQLEAEKVRYKKMQCDLQKELSATFEENTKLTTLLDGKVPKDLLDGMELDRIVGGLKKELAESRDLEGSLRAQLGELAPLQEKVKNLLIQVSEQSAELQAQADQAQQLQEALQASQQESLSLQEEVHAARLRADNLSQQSAEVAKQLESLHSDLETCQGEKEQLLVSTEEMRIKLFEVEQWGTSQESKMQEVQQLVKDLEEKLAHSEVCRSTEEEISKELQEQVKQLAEDLQHERAERDALLSEKRRAELEPPTPLAVGESELHVDLQRSVEAQLSTVTMERDQLRTDLQENVELMIENQEELRTTLQRNRVLEEQIKNLEKQQKDLTDEHALLVQELQNQVSSLSKELERVRADGHGAQAEEMEKLLSKLTSISQEREQLQEALEGQRQEKQPRTELEDTIEILHAQLKQVKEDLHRVCVERDVLAEKAAHLDSTTEDIHIQLSTVTSERDQLKTDLQENVELMIENQEELRTTLQRNIVLEEEIKDLEKLASEQKGLTEKEHALQVQGLQNQVSSLSKELEKMRADGDGTQAKEMEKLLSRLTSFTQEREQLQEALEGQRQEKKQLRTELEDTIETLQAQLQQVREDLHNICAERDSHAEKAAHLESTTEEVKSHLSIVTMERDHLQEALEEQKQEKKQLRVELEDTIETLQAQVSSLSKELEKVRVAGDGAQAEEMEKLLSKLTSISQEREELQEALEGQRQEKRQLRTDLEDTIETLQAQLQQVREDLRHVCTEKDVLAEKAVHLQSTTEDVNTQLSTVTSERDQLKSDLQENVELMIENQEELRTTLQRNSVLEEQIKDLEKLATEQKDLAEKECAFQVQELQNQVNSLSMELERVRADGDGAQAEEMERLLSRLTSLSQEKEQLQDALEGQRQKKDQLRAELENTIETLQAQVTHLQSSLQAITEQRSQLENDIQKKIELVASTGAVLEATQEELQKQNQKMCDLEKKKAEEGSSLAQQLEVLQGNLKCAEVERDVLLSEKEASLQASKEETEKLLSRVSSLSQERDQLQKVTEELRQAEQQLRAQLKEKLEMISVLHEEQSQQEALFSQLQEDGKRQEAELQEEIHRLNEQHASTLEEKVQLARDLRVKREGEESEPLRQDQAEVESTTQQPLDDGADEEEARSVELSSRLQEGSDELKGAFGRLQNFVVLCGKCDVQAFEMVHIPEGYSTSATRPNSLTSKVVEVRQQTLLIISHVAEHLRERAQAYRAVFEELLEKDLSAFEEWRLQEAAVHRARRPRSSAYDQDHHLRFERRLAELLERRKHYPRMLSDIVERLRDDMRKVHKHLAEEAEVMMVAMQHEKEMIGCTSVVKAEVERILKVELERRTLMASRREATLKTVKDEHNQLMEQLKLLQTQAGSWLEEDWRQNAALLRRSLNTMMSSEKDLLRGNQQLALQLQQTEEKLRALHVQVEQLQEAQTKADRRVSNHKQATQLLQTELEDTRAQVQEKENTLQSLKLKLEHSESAAQIETLQAKLFKTQLELTTASSEHQQEVDRLNALLSEKEERVRKLKEVVRDSQQGEGSFLQGKDLHARLTSAGDLASRSSVLLEKKKLEEEVIQLQAKISQLESMVSSQQAEITKWKSRALRLKEKSKREEDGFTSPCKSTKRTLPMTSDPQNTLSPPKRFFDSPRKALDSNGAASNSPRSSFFSSKSEISSMYPKQFFDNSALGLLPEVTNDHDAEDRNQGPAATPAAPATEDKKDWWPTSPKQEDLCPTQ